MPSGAAYLVPTSRILVFSRRDNRAKSSSRVRAAQKGVREGHRNH